MSEIMVKFEELKLKVKLKLRGMSHKFNNGRAYYPTVLYIGLCCVMLGIGIGRWWL